MTSKITLYYKCKITKEKNFVLDSISQPNYSTLGFYLSTLTSEVINDFQYVKHALSLSIKINKSQTALNMGLGSDDLNYCSIQNGNQRTKFYFIVNKIWRSENTIELILMMDTLNSFVYDVDYEISQKTFVRRMHKNRFYNRTEYLPIRQKYRLFRLIDLKSEDINAPLYKISERALLEQNGESNIDWKLYYKNSSNQENSPVDCYLVPSEAVKLKYISSDGVLDATNLSDGYYCIFFVDYNSPSITFELDGSFYTPSKSSAGGYTTYQAVALLNDGGTIKAWSGQFAVGSSSYGSWTPISIDVVNAYVNSTNNIKTHKASSLPNVSEVVSNQMWLAVYAETTLVVGGSSTQTLYGDNTIDKTLESNIKVINCPYSPTSYSINNLDVYTFDDCWSYNVADGKLKLTNFNKRFVNHVVTNVEDITNNYLLECDPSDLDGSASRTFKDSKLFHSDYFRPKFVYDSFIKVFPLEQLEVPETGSSIVSAKFNFDFVMSRNIVSKFLFKFNYTWSHPMEDYPNIVCVSRNNEEVLYSSQYLNYVRTGFNFDQKAKERQDAMAGIGIGMNIAGLVASGVIGAVTGNPLAVGSAVGSAIGLVNQLVNYAKTSVQNEENIQRKLAESKMQSVSVLNADDFDLLYEYTSNRAKLCEYKVSSQMESILDDLFYYGGYIINEQRKPIKDSRHWFNYVQADLVINHTENMTEEIENDIKEKFSNGVTFMHYHLGVFDLNQEKENLEEFLIR